MKTIPFSSWVLPVALLVAPVVAKADPAAQLPISRVSGIVKVSLTTGVNRVGIPFIREPAITPKYVTASTNAGATTITSAGALFIPNAFNNTHSVLFISGPSDGLAFPITSNTASDLAIDGSIPFPLKANLDRFLVIPDWTLGTLIPDGGGLQPTEDVQIGVATETYNWDGTNWRDSSNVISDDVRIPHLVGLTITVAAPIDFFLTGVTRTGTQRFPRLKDDDALVSNPFFANLTLASLATLVNPAPSSTGADTVTLGGQVYFLRSGQGFRLVSAPDGANQNSVVFPVGSAALVTAGQADTVQSFPRRWRLGRPLRAFRRPEPSTRADVNWVVQEPFVTGP